MLFKILNYSPNQIEPKPNLNHKSILIKMANFQFRFGITGGEQFITVLIYGTAYEQIT